MESKLTTFVTGLAVSSPQEHILTSRLGSDSNLAAFLNGSGYIKSELVSLACYTLKLALETDSVDQTPVNRAEVEINWTQTCWETPSCAVLPKTAQAVSTTLKIVNFFQVKFAVRSGGHSPNPGWSSINQPGVLIDLQRLNQITVNADKTVASVGPGGRWGDVYAALDPHNVSVIGGRIPSVGIGGLILGGGYFYFSSQYGLAADNVKNFEIVIADGTIVHANSQQNSDLFWALKGGGPNFGIVTQFDLYTIPVKDIWYSITVYPPDQNPAILNAMAEWQENGAVSDSKGTVNLLIALESTTVLLMYSEPANNPATFAPFYSIPPAAVAMPASNYTVLSILQLVGTLTPDIPQRHDYRAVSSKVDLQLYLDVYTFWREQALAVYNETGANQTFVIQPVPVTLVEQGNLKGGNPLGLPNESFQCWTTLVDWDDAQDDATVRAVSIATSAKWKRLGEERGLYIPFEYMNDASRDQNPLASYGNNNLLKLKAIAQKYDPSQVFQKLQNGGFLLSKV
ncbi:putative 6-hydroxy-D-nicotine oxidase [Tricladium varicosporioides]|nr:putative 6-hydroxy-D-nicotine oxidase [Hymenoscyphus varicosporioides]